MKKRNRKWIATLVLTILVLGGIFLFLWNTGFFAAAKSLEGIQDYIARFSPYSHLVFFLVQLASVVIAPIPSNITAAGGALLFGMWPAFLLTAGAVVLGSAAVFWLARILGQSFAGRFVSQKVSDQYLDLIRRKRDVFLALVFLFPFFPDDLICILAGLTDISFSRFLVIVVLTRPWGLLVASAVGGSVISIPIWAMVLIGLAGLALFLVAMKYGDRWEAWLLEKFKQ
ncbi:VTT domain-containing protein [uncultured Pseudoflavonifractor sp.]|uniref:TVP38/TMEM64 family protein n=1 Tax=uncultured Pseudoflavonifractor sp. TaxID=1221379 RepID=UPI0025DF7663|nr:VTT domain-containing protein [uncultured Pseudoflavonifractor sp.]